MANVGHGNRHAAAIIVAVLAVMFLAQASWFAARHSLTYDETVYLNLAIQSARERRLDTGFMALGAAPLAPLLTCAPPILITGRSVRPSQDWDARLNGPQLIRTPRLMTSLLVGVPLVVTVFLG